MSFDEEASAELGPVPEGFNFGAFVFSGVFLLGYGRVGMFFLWLVVGGLLNLLGFFGALIASFLGLVFSIYCGFEAKQIAWDSDRFTTYAELDRSMRRWNIAALLFVVLLVALFLATRA